MGRELASGKARELPSGKRSFQWEGSFSLFQWERSFPVARLLSSGKGASLINGKRASQWEGSFLSS